ncbi:hypothetical protein NOZE110980_18010 [Nocardioides zeicaulis]
MPTPTADRPPLESLLPRREPGANMPRTGADAFLPPETSGATGPLFGKRSTPATPATDAPAAGPSAPTPAEPASASAAPAEPQEKVASVVPITALASRQRAQAEEARASEPVAEPVAEPVVEEPVSEPVAEEPVVEAPVVEEPVAEAPVRTPDPLTDPLPTEAPVAEEPAGQELVEEPVEEPVAEEPAARAEPEVEVDADDPLGLGTPSRPAAPVQPEPVIEPEPEPVVVAEPEPAPAPSPVFTPVAAARAEQPGDTLVADPEPEAAPAVALADPLAGGLPTRTPGAAAEINRDMPGLPPTTEPARANGDSPIFKSMRSGWLTGDATQIHETEVDRGWEIAEHVAEEAPAPVATPAGLPRRAPGERLVPGSVTPPTATKTRDPEAIRRRLQAHTAGVSRGRRAAQSSPQHTEAGPA